MSEQTLFSEINYRIAVSSDRCVNIPNGIGSNIKVKKWAMFAHFPSEFSNISHCSLYISGIILSNPCPFTFYKIFIVEIMFQLICKLGTKVFA